jgi:adenosylhomocysteine nucleosidase
MENMSLNKGFSAALILILGTTMLAGCVENEKETVGVLVAVNYESDAFMDAWALKELGLVGGFRFYEEDRDGKKIVFVKSGYGKVNAAAATALLINEFSVDHVIFAGTSGPVNESLSIGDIIVSDDVFQYDVGRVSDDEYELWGVEINEEEITYLKANEKLKNLALNSAVNLNKVKGRTPKVIEGRIATADQFDERESFGRWISQFDVECVEMEGGAVAQVCYKFDTPFVVLRAISNGSYEEYEKYAYEVSANLALLTDAIIRGI